VNPAPSNQEQPTFTAPQQGTLSALQGQYRQGHHLFSRQELGRLRFLRWLHQTVSITCSASDALSGVATSTCKAITGPAYSFGPGSHTFSATAIDKAGNVGSGSASFVVKVTVAGLCNLTKQYFADQQIASSLCVLLSQGKITAYIAVVHTCSFGGQTTAAHAALLIQPAQAL
jgi:hypothetical protein